MGVNKLENNKANLLRTQKKQSTAVTTHKSEPALKGKECMMKIVDTVIVIPLM